MEYIGIALAFIGAALAVGLSCAGSAIGRNIFHFQGRTYEN